MSKETRDKLRAMPLEELRKKRDGLRLILSAWAMGEEELIQSAHEKILDNYDDVVAILTTRSLDEEGIDL